MVFACAHLVGSAATTDREHNEAVAAALELAFGIALLLLAWPQRRQDADVGRAGPSRMNALLDRLRGLRPGTATVSDDCRIARPHGFVSNAWACGCFSDEAFRPILSL